MTVPGPAIGATPVEGGARFVVWAPDARSVELVLDDERIDAAATTDGYWSVEAPGAGHGTRYRWSIDHGAPTPDPASRWQPDGVHGPSAVVDPARFTWTDGAWTGRTMSGSVVYELHVGTFTPGGTLDSAIADLDRLAALGVTTIELMPLNAFAGTRNWGYDGVFPFAVHHAYGGPEALARFVDAAHARGLAVLLDVVYNHLGPEGNYLGCFGPYFTDEYRTPWGTAVNVAGAGSDGVRHYFASNVRWWLEALHVDGFRFDAIHAVVDPTANPFWGELCDTARATATDLGRDIALIAETADNDPRHLHPRERNGIGFDAVWCDDVHHNLLVAVTGFRGGYLADYTGTPEELADTLAHRWKFRGQYSIARGRHHGRPVDDVAPDRFVVCSQNHDQVGNRPAGDRPDHRVGPARRRYLAAAVLLSPATPMLFQGEEYGELAPFPFFVDHTDPDVLSATNEGRRAEFAAADWTIDVPEPGARSTFESAILDPTVVERDDRSARLLAMYTEALRLRREVTAVAEPVAEQTVELVGDVIAVRRSHAGTTSHLLLNASDDAAAVDAAGRLLFDSGDARWGGDRPVTHDGDTRHLPAWTVALVVST